MFGANGVLLCLYAPYGDWEISLAELIAMLCLSFICYAASLKEFFATHKNSEAETFQQANPVLDGIINVSAVVVLAFMGGVFAIGVSHRGYIELRMSKIRKDRMVMNLHIKAAQDRLKTRNAAIVKRQREQKFALLKKKAKGKLTPADEAKLR